MLSQNGAPPVSAGARDSDAVRKVGTRAVNVENFAQVCAQIFGQICAASRAQSRMCELPTAGLPCQA